MKKRLLSILLVLSLVLSLFSVSASALGDFSSISAEIKLSDNTYSNWDSFVQSSDDNYAQNICNSTWARAHNTEYTYDALSQFCSAYNLQSDNSGYYFSIESLEGTAYYGIRIHYRVGTFGGGRRSHDSYGSYTVNWLCDNSHNAVVASGQSVVPASQAVPLNQIKNTTVYKMLSYDTLYNVCQTYNTQHNLTGLRAYSLALKSDSYYWCIQNNGQYVLCDSAGLPYGAPSNKSVTQEPRYNSEVVNSDGEDVAVDENSTSTINFDDHSVITFEGDTEEIYNSYYDSHDKTYYVSTEEHEYLYQYFIDYTYVYNIGQTSEFDQYKAYYQLPDGRSSAELTKEELEQLNLNIDVINYQAVADTSTLRALWHLDGNLSDSSYYSSLNKVTWGNGSSNIASITYMDVAQFGGALYLGNTNDYDVSFILSRYSPTGDFTVEFRLYQSAINSSSGVANSLRLNVRGVDVLTSDGVTFTDFSGSTFNCPSGQWNHYVFQYESATGKMVFCLNGSLRSYATVSLSGLSSFHALDLYIKNGCGSYYMLDEVRVSDDSIYPSTFSPSQVPFDTNLTLVLPDVEDDNGAPVLLSASSLGDMVDASEFENSPAYSSFSEIDNQALVTQDGAELVLVPLTATSDSSSFYFYAKGVTADSPCSLVLLDSLLSGSISVYLAQTQLGGGYPCLASSDSASVGDVLQFSVSPFKKYLVSSPVSFSLLCNGISYIISSSDFSSSDHILDFTPSSEYPDYPVGNLFVFSYDNLSDSSDSFSYTVSLSDTSVSGTYGSAIFNDGIAQFTISSGTFLDISGLPAGITYSVAQTENSSYTTTSSGASGTITAYSTSSCIFRNTYIPPSPSVGGLRIQTVNNGGNQSDSFSYMVTLSDTSISGTYGLAIFSNGVGNISIASGSYADITGLPAGITYSVAQTENSSYTTTSSGASGIITADEQAQAIFTNTYIPPVIPDEPDEPHPSVPQTVEHPILAVKTQIPVTDYQIGGVRPVYPSKGLVYALVESGYITSVQIYTGYAWEGVDARIWTGSRWIPYSYLNVITLNDMYDIVDASGQSGYEYIYTDTGFWAWLQKWLIQFKTDLFEKLVSGSSESINISNVNNTYDVDIDVDSGVSGAVKLLDFVQGLFSDLGENLNGFFDIYTQEDESLYILFPLEGGGDDGS